MRCSIPGRRRAVVAMLAAVSPLAGMQFAAETIVASDQQSSTANESLARSVAWLAKQQRPDGSWRSTTYGQMRGGVGITSLVLYAWSRLPDSLQREHAEVRDRAEAFLLTELSPHGYVQGRERESDYPTYATALTVLALKRRPTAAWRS